MFILPAVYCAPSHTPLFHTEMFQTSKIFRIHGDRILPPAFADDAATVKALADRKRLQLRPNMSDAASAQMLVGLASEPARILQLEAQRLPQIVRLWRQGSLLAPVETAFLPERLKARRCGTGGVAAIRPPWVH